MATSSLGAPDLSLLRGSDHYIEDVVLHATPLIVVATLTITSVPALHPFVELVVSGSMSGVAVGQLVRIDRNGSPIAYAVVRKTPVGSTLYISETQNGSFGYAGRIEYTIAINDTVTIYNHHPLWSLYSRIADKQFFKQWDVPYTDQNRYPPPVANTGEWQSAKISVGDSASFRLPRFGSNTSFAFGSSTITSYLWNLPAGITLQSGYNLSDSVIEVYANAGMHLVSLTVTDSQSKTHTAYTWLFVSDGTTGMSLSERFPISITSDRQTPQGREVSIEITSDAELSDYIFAGCGFLLKEYPKYGGSELSSGVSIDSFVGYLTGDVSSKSDGDMFVTSFTIQSPLMIADNMPQPPQSLNEVSGTPANWTQCTSVLSNPRGFLYYAIKWHTPALLDMHDFDAPLTSPRRRFCDYSTNTLGDACRVVSAMLVGNIGSASNGSTVLRQNPMYFDNSSRNSLASVITWLAQDIQAPLTIQRRFNRPFAEARTGAFWTNGTSDSAGYAVKRWYQGVGKTELSNFTVTPAEGISRIKDVVGHHLALMNSSIASISLTTTRNYDVVDPVYMLWNRVTISEEFDSFGEGFSSDRFLPTQISRTWQTDNGDVIKKIEIQLQPETYGQAGEEWKIGSAQTQSANGWSLGVNTPYSANYDSAFGGSGLVILLDDDGQLAITYNIIDTIPVWGVLDNDLYIGTINDVCFDYDSPFFANGNSVDQSLDIYFITTSGDTLRVYHQTDILGNPQIPEVVQTISMSDSTVNTNARIESSETYPDLLIVAWKDGTGTFYRRYIDGVGWGSSTRIGNAIADSTDYNDAPLGLAVYGEKQLITAPDALGSYKLYYSSTASGSFAQVTNTETSSAPMPTIKIANSSIAYVSTSIASISNYFVDFDGGGLLTYTTTDSGLDSLVTTGGNPNNCFKGTAASEAVGQRLIVGITLPATVSIVSVSCDIYSTNTTTPIGYSGTWDLEIRSGGSSGTILRSGTVWDASGVTPQIVADDGVYHTYETVATDSFTPPYVGNYVRVQARTAAGAGGSRDIRIDNIKIYYSSGGIGGYSLYRVTSYSGSSTWDDVTPDISHAPSRPHDLVVNRINNGVLDVSTDDGQYYLTTDAGVTWDLQDATSDYKTFVTQGEGVLTAGTTGVALSLDNRATFDDKTGDLASKLGTINTIKRILTL